jgi:hypothetical protein
MAEEKRPDVPTDETDSADVLRDYERDQQWKVKFAPRDPGEFLVRILPPPVRGRYYKEFGVHYDINCVSSAFGDRRACGCPKMAYGQKCPLCALTSQLFFESKQPGVDPETRKHIEEYAKGIKSKYRVVLNLYLVNQKDKGVLLWEIGREANDLIRPLFGDYGDITNPKTGRDLVVRFHRKDKWNVVQSVTPRLQTSEISLEGWREQRHDLDGYVANAMIDDAKMKEALEAAGTANRLTGRSGGGEGQAAENKPAAADPDNVGGDEPETAEAKTGGNGPTPSELAEAEKPAIDPVAALAEQAGVDTANEEVKKLLDKMKETMGK